MTIPKDVLVAAVREVLDHAATGKGDLLHYMTAYQILQRIPDDLRAALIAEYAKPGRGAGKPFSAASRIGQIAAEVGEQDYLDARGLSFYGDDAEEPVVASYPVVTIYRARRP